MTSRPTTTFVRSLAWPQCAVALALVAGCASAQLPLHAQIDVLIGDAACTQDSDCRSIGIGAKACGGPQAYRAWSTTSTDASALAAAVASHRDERLREIARSGELSTCAVVQDPGAYCRREPSVSTGRCELRPMGAPAGNSGIR